MEHEENRELLILGSGGSLGVPVLCCSCPVCRGCKKKRQKEGQNGGHRSDEDHPPNFNQRTRAGALLRRVDREGNKRSFLFDAGPDIRSQLFTHGIEHLDGVFLTHTHYDHVGGWDDLRPFPFMARKPLPCLLSHEAKGDLEKQFPYLFSPAYTNPGVIRARKGASSEGMQLFQLRVVEGEKVEFEGVEVRSVTYQQKGMTVLGYRVGNLAYFTDLPLHPFSIPQLEEKILQMCEGVDVLVLSASLQKGSHHLPLEEAIALAQKVRKRHGSVREVYFTHLGHDIDYFTVDKELPPSMHLAYDGLRIALSGG